MRKEKKEILIIEFKDRSTKTINDPFAGEISKAIRAFQNGESKISVGTISGGLGRTVVSTSEIRSITPKWIRVEETYRQDQRTSLENKDRPPNGRRIPRGHR